MTAVPEQEPEAEADALELAADQAIVACSGDLRGAIKALILANQYLEEEIHTLMALISKGYVRGLAPRLPTDRKDWYG